MTRRTLLTTGLTTGVLGSAGGIVNSPVQLEAAQAASAASDHTLERVASAITELRDELRQERQFIEIAPIRAAQKQFLRQNGKLPDVIEVGADIWFQAYDWHVRWQLTPAEGRDAQGRLTLAMNQTLVVLRPDAQASFVGLPYDAR
jgi:hypothetical protein